MATQANAGTAKGATATVSKDSLLRAGAPQIRTAAAIVEKHEQIVDALERQAITGKIAEQLHQGLKGIMAVASLEMRYWNMVAKWGRKAPVPRSPLLRNVIGLPEQLSPADGEKVRQLIPER